MIWHHTVLESLAHMIFGILAMAASPVATECHQVGDYMVRPADLGPGEF